MSNYEMKKDIITGSLFGVDIESSGVEITHLRLWLSLIDDFDVSREEREIDTLPKIDITLKKVMPYLVLAHGLLRSKWE
jgi:hypothetical protein